MNIVWQLGWIRISGIDPSEFVNVTPPTRSCMRLIHELISIERSREYIYCLVHWSYCVIAYYMACAISTVCSVLFITMKKICGGIPMVDPMVMTARWD